MVACVMDRRPPGTKRTDTLVPYTPLFRAAGGATAKPVARTSAAQVLRKSATPVRRVALQAPRAGRPAPITSRLHMLNQGSDQRLQLRLISHELHRSEEHTSELQSLMRISYAVFCLKKKTTHQHQSHTREPD